jgi:hypothetical protein
MAGPRQEIYAIKSTFVNRKMIFYLITRLALEADFPVAEGGRESTRLP